MHSSTNFFSLKMVMKNKIMVRNVWLLERWHYTLFCIWVISEDLFRFLGLISIISGLEGFELFKKLFLSLDGIILTFVRTFLERSRNINKKCKLYDVMKKIFLNFRTWIVFHDYPFFNSETLKKNLMLFPENYIKIGLSLPEILRAALNPKITIFRLV